VPDGPLARHLGFVEEGCVKRRVILLLVLLPQIAAAQLIPGSQTIIPSAGTLLPINELLRTSAIYPPLRPTDEEVGVVTDISLDPGLFIGLRYGYALTRRLQIEAEFDWAVAVHVIRQLELREQTEANTQPQYETTTQDAHILQYGVGMTYYLANWQHARPFLVFGFGSHDMNLVPKGEVNPDPIRDRYILAGLGTTLPVSDRLGIQIEVRDFMYNFRYDNQFVDPGRTPPIVAPRDIYESTGISATKFQDDVVLSVSFAIRLF
jgi:hypothetical protein